MTDISHIGKRVEVYKNLHKNCWSVRHKGKVISYAKTVDITLPSFIVRPAGRAKTLKDKRKNVHAFVRGELVSIGLDLDSLPIRVRYNPYLAGYFFTADNNQPIYTAKCAHLHVDGTLTVKE